MSAVATAPPRTATGPRVLVVLWDGGGNATTVLLLVARLVRDGARVTVLSNPSLRERIVATGAAYRPYRHAPRHDPRTPDGDALRIWEADSPANAARLIRDRLMFGPAAGFHDDVSDAARDMAPDVVMCDYVLLGGLVAAERLGLRHVVVMDSIYPLPTPALTGATAAAHGPFRPLFARMVAAGLPGLNRLRERHGLPALDAAGQQYERASHCLVMTYAHVDPAAPTVPPGVVHVGPQVDLAAHPDPTPARHDRPRVVVSLATSQQPGQDALLESLLTAADGLSADVQVLGGLLAPDRMVPGNVTASGFRPLEELLPETDVLVTHGGHGTTVRGLLWGVPTLVLPAAQDQFDNARRVAALGAGLERRQDATPGQLRDALELLVTAPEYRRAARAACAALRAEHDPDAAARIVIDTALVGRR